MRTQYNQERVDALIKFIQNLKVTVGEEDAIGQPFILAPFQRKFIEDVYGPTDPANPAKRLVNKGIFSVGRKCGKSELGAALVLAHLIGPESERNGQIVCAATTRDQARVVFDKVVQFIQMSPTLQKYLGISDKAGVVYVKPGTSKRAAGSKYRALPYRPRAALGLNPNLVIFDELCAERNRKFYDALVSSQKARKDPFFLVISTQAGNDDHVLSDLIDRGLRTNEDGTPLNPRTVVHLHTADLGCDLLDRAQHRKATPAIGLWVDEQRFYDEAVEATQSLQEEAQFRLYALNQRVSLDLPVITGAQWNAVGPPPLPAPAIRTQQTFQFDKGERLIGATDLSARMDLCAHLWVSAETTAGEPARIKSHFFKPAQYLQRHGDRDGFDYSAFARAGWITPVDGPDIDPSHVVSLIAEYRENYDILGIAYDRDVKLTQEFMRAFERADIRVWNGAGEPISGALRIEPWGQGFQSMHIGIQAIEHAVLNQKIMHDGNPILGWNISNAKVLVQRTGIGRKLVKSKEESRIDGAICLAMALGWKTIVAPEFTIVNPYDDDAFSLTALL